MKRPLRGSSRRTRPSGRECTASRLKGGAQQVLAHAFEASAITTVHGGGGVQIHPVREGDETVRSGHGGGGRGRGEGQLNVPLPLPLKMFRTPVLGELMVKGMHAFVKVFLFRAGVVHRERLGANERAAYLAPHPRWADRTSVPHVPPRDPIRPEGPVSDMLGELHDRLVPAFRDKPVFIAWPMKDIAFTPEMLETLWLADFPDAEVMRVKEAGHYIQEDAHELVIPQLLEFLERDADSPDRGVLSSSS